MGAFGYEYLLYVLQTTTGQRSDGEVEGWRKDEGFATLAVVVRAESINNNQPQHACGPLFPLSLAPDWLHQPSHPSPILAKPRAIRRDSVIM